MENAGRKIKINYNSFGFLYNCGKLRSEIKLRFKAWIVNTNIGGQIDFRKFEKLVVPAPAAPPPPTCEEAVIAGIKDCRKAADKCLDTLDFEKDGLDKVQAILLRRRGVWAQRDGEFGLDLVVDLLGHGFRRGACGVPLV